MPSEIFFAGGVSVKVMADVDAVTAALNEGATLIATQRFAGFRGDEAVPGQQIVVSVPVIAYAAAITA